MSHHEDALRAFAPVPKRCPKTSLEEEAMFQIATSLEQLGRRAEAGVAYRAYVEKYPNTARARIATKAIQILSGL